MLKITDIIKNLCWSVSMHSGEHNDVYIVMSMFGDYENTPQKIIKKAQNDSFLCSINNLTFILKIKVPASRLQISQLRHI